MLGAYIHLQEMQNFKFGRIPCPSLPPERVDAFNSSSDIPCETKRQFVTVLSSLFQLRRAAAEAALPLEQDPFSRRNIFERFYKTGDFSQFFCDEYWWETGVWGPPIA